MALAFGPLSSTPSLLPMDDAEFARWVRLLEARTGVVVAPERKPFLVGAVRARMREAGFADYASYYTHVAAEGTGLVEWTTLVDRLTVHETRFFRHPPSLQLIGERWLPEQLRAGARALHAWSIGCASGEEAYSLAMVLDRKLALSGADAQTYVGVTATDVSHAALVAARAAVYPAARLGEIPPEYRADYVQALDEDSFTVVERLRRRVGFAMLNLLDAGHAPLKQLDLIYCQNVLIYFARERRRELLAQLAGLLRPGGLLLLGAGEITAFAHPLLTRVACPGTLAYLRNR